MAMFSISDLMRDSVVNKGAQIVAITTMRVAIKTIVMIILEIGLLEWKVVRALEV